MWSTGLACLGITSLAGGLLWHKRSKRAMLPPSPLGHWFWGNKNIVEGPFSAMIIGTKAKQKYGDIISLTSPVETVIVVNTIDLSNELLEKRASVTANRPNKVILDEIMGWGRIVSWHTHDEWHKKIRRMMASALSPSAARNYAPQQTEIAVRISKQLMLNPSGFAETILQELGAFFMKMTYGYVAVENDPVIMTAHQAIGYYVMGFLCHFWVDWFPFLRFLPDWFPGAGFKTFGKEGKALLDRFANEPFDAVLDQLKHGRVENVSYSSRLLEEKGGLKASAEDIDLIRWSCASLFGGGSSTSVGIIATFFILIPLYPEFARRAQEEIDGVTSRDRLPNLEDIPRMPYFNALLQEVMRTYPSVPLGIPHCASEEIPFKGYVIPKGAIIYGNIWGMLHDPEQFPEPFTFNPDRFLSSTPEPDPRQYIYGFGRRVCPGFHVANNGIWIICSTILALFDAQPNEDLLARVADVGGRDSKDLYKVIHGYASGRSPCNLVLRDQVAASLLEHS